MLSPIKFFRANICIYVLIVVNPGKKISKSEINK